MYIYKIGEIYFNIRGGKVVWGYRWNKIGHEFITLILDDG